jgi:hypothetical protein
MEQTINNSIINTHPGINEIIKELRTQYFLPTIRLNKSILACKTKNQSADTFKLKEVVLKHDTFYILTVFYVASLIKESHYK